jgi:hypothetical protein
MQFVSPQFRPCNGNTYLNAAALADQKTGLAAFGPVRTFSLEDESLRGGMQTRTWKITTANGRLTAIERGYPDGKLEQFMVTKAQ